jgi:branched-chain amino acid transport system substrate-binding protein
MAGRSNDDRFREDIVKRRSIFGAGLATAMALSGLSGAYAEDVLKIGLILPMTGPFASTGHQIEAAVKLYMQQAGDTVAGKKIQLIVKDDASTPDLTKRLAQELIVNEKAGVLASSFTMS